MTRIGKTIALFLAYGAASTMGLLLLKMSLSDKMLGIRTISGVVRIVSDLRFVLGFLMYCSSFLIWLYILSKYPLTLSYPIANSLVLVLVTLIGVIVFKEQLGWLQQVGLLFCLLGIVLVYIR